MAYLMAIIAGVVVLLIIFFVILFDALFPPVDMEAMNKKERKPFDIYFSDTQERFLVSEKRFVFKEEDPALQAREIIRALLDGSKTGQVNTFPDNVALKDVRLDKDGTAQVSFSKALIQNHPGGSAAEMATIYSLTNTLTANIPAIKAVKLLVDGKELPSIKGHISTQNAFLPDPDLFAPVKSESH